MTTNTTAPAHEAAQTAAKILTYLGFAQAVSMEPGTDRRRDHIQSLIANALSRLRAPVAHLGLPDVLPEFTSKSGAQFVSMGTVQTVLRAARAALASAPVAGEAVYTLRVRGAIQAWTPTAAAFSIPDGEHQLFLGPVAPPADEAVRILFPSHLRKMWSGGEVQAWLDEHQGVTAPKPSAKGSLERYRKWQAEQASEAQCSCPSGDGSLGWPCAKHPQAPHHK